MTLNVKNQGRQQQNKREFLNEWVKEVKDVLNKAFDKLRPNGN